jgi:hypothetical protein
MLRAAALASSSGGMGFLPTWTPWRTPAGGRWQYHFKDSQKIYHFKEAPIRVK